MTNNTKVGEYKPTITANPAKIANKFPPSFLINNAPIVNGIGTSKQPLSNPSIRKSLNSCRSAALRHETKNSKPNPNSIPRMLTVIESIACEVMTANGYLTTRFCRQRSSPR
jgi:hypothetical protein